MGREDEEKLYHPNDENERNERERERIMMKMKDDKRGR